MIRFGTDEVREALTSAGGERYPNVVALESAVMTHGLPRQRNLEAMSRMIDAVRSAGAVPAVIGAMGGELVVGLSDDEIESLGGNDRAVKASARDLSWALATKSPAGLTVAGTLVACRLAGIRVFATGGVGGVHRGWTVRPDVSADLDELASTPTCVVSAGAKSILDIPATLEALDSRGVPVIGYRCDFFPQFHSLGDEAVPAPRRLDDLQIIARVIDVRWSDLRQLGGALVANPIPESFAIPQAELNDVIERAMSEADRRGVRGPDVTPFLLAALADATGGRSVEANIALLESNARVAAELAGALATLIG